jgi:MFS family permease
MADAVRYVFGQRSLAAMMGFMLLAGLFCSPPVVIMIPAIVRDQLHRGAGTLGALTAAVGVGSVLGSVLLLRLSRRVNKGEPLLAGFFVTAAAVAGVGASGTVALSLALGVLGGLAGVVYIGLSTVVVQSVSSDEMRARTIAIWAAAFVGMLPLGSLITGGLAAVFGAGGAVLIDGLVAFAGGVAILAARQEVSWLGCAALPEACVAATSPAVLALEEVPSGSAARDAA